MKILVLIKQNISFLLCLGWVIVGGYLFFCKNDRIAGAALMLIGLIYGVDYFIPGERR